MEDKIIAWSFSGAAARAIAHFRMAEVAMSRGEKPSLIIGNSSGALAAPIIAVAYDRPEIMKSARKFAETLDMTDMFPYLGNKPFTKKGKIAPNAIGRLLTHNHLGWQDIKPLYKKVFTQEHFELLQKSSIKCYAFGVKGKSWTPVSYCLNDAKSLDDMIDMIECSSRIVPFVQPMIYKGEGHVDGGYIAFNPGWTLFKKYKMKTLISFYSHELHEDGMVSNPNWDKSVLSVTTQAMNGMAYWHGVKDAELEESLSLIHGVKYLRLEAPDGYTDEVYETDDDQLIALGNASYVKAMKAWDKFELSNNSIG